MYATKTIEVDIDMDDFGTDDLIEELENRGVYIAPDGDGSIYELYELKRFNSPMFEKTFADFVYDKIGRIL